MTETDAEASYLAELYDHLVTQEEEDGGTTPGKGTITKKRRLLPTYTPHSGAHIAELLRYEVERQQEMVRACLPSSPDCLLPDRHLVRRHRGPRD